ncbi:DUF493 domain-containing protein [Thiohalobacter sp. IOR34]|uniref:YbeD family protein n=1 Tax=Thiohalobacter sp. IOR34 TaxID=3057176 RepID=UPI0025AED5F9|nr:DUF493 domain-containing protein [Thiohalobacter sp. IOR34]WJW75925.1 DUF493 domain-containing protein [Thiohalobacter sp. IOR34]
MTDSADSPIEFPCDFPVKVMGRHSEHFEAHVVTLVRRHVPDLGEGAVSTRASGKGNYLSVTVRIRATSREQLDALYRELTADDEILMVL